MAFVEVALHIKVKGKLYLLWVVWVVQFDQVSSTAEFIYVKAEGSM